MRWWSRGASACTVGCGHVYAALHDAGRYGGGGGGRTARPLAASVVSGTGGGSGGSGAVLCWLYLETTRIVIE